MVRTKHIRQRIHKIKQLAGLQHQQIRSFHLLSKRNDHANFHSDDGICFVSQHFS